MATGKRRIVPTSASTLHSTNSTRDGGKTQTYIQTITGQMPKRYFQTQIYNNIITQQAVVLINY